MPQARCLLLSLVAAGALGAALAAPCEASPHIEAYFQRPEVLLPTADPDPSVPGFAAFLGHEPGEWFTSPEQAVAYLEALDAASDRLTLQPLGRSWEGRPLVLAVVSAPENLQRLDEIQEAHARLRAPETSRADRDALAARLPVLVWLGYSIHGDEHSGTEAALLAAQHLAADRTEETRRWLEEAVILIDPMQNPDGRARFLAAQDSTVARDPNGHPVPDPAPEAAEHQQPWPGGRFNHYLFDLNRDWFYLTQPETRARVAALQAWRPQVFVDLHEMGSNETYFFPPPTDPINPHLPEAMHGWWEVFGAGNAAMMDSFGVDYYTREVFDAFYPGYGDSFPAFLGAVGMTYEQGSAAGLAIRRRDGDVLTLREAAWHHLLASLATIRTAVAHREGLLRDFGRFHEDGRRSGDAGPREIWITGGPAGAVADLGEHLERLGVSALRPAGEVHNPGLRPLVGEGPPPERLPDEGLLISLDQPLRRLVLTLFERDVPLDPVFLRGEQEKRRRREPDGFYDVTAWNLALAYGVDGWSSDRPSVGETRPAQALRDGGVRSPEEAVAFLLRYDGDAAAAAVVELLRVEPPLPVRMALRGFQTGGRRFERGTLVIRAGARRQETLTALRTIGESHGVWFEGVRSSLTEEGIDLGSSRVIPLRLPRVALLWDAPTDPSSAGWLAYVLEQRLGMPYTRLRADAVRRIHPGDMDVLLVPDADLLGARYEEHLGPGGLERLGRWIEAGGILVGIGGGAALATRPAAAWIPGREITRRVAAGGEAGSPASGEEDDMPAAEDLPDATPGAIAWVVLDERHPLTVGYGGGVAVPVVSRLAFRPPEDRRDVAAFDAADRLLLSGFMWDDTRTALAGQSYLVAEESGEGQVILFAGEPTFRGAWPSLHRLLLNAILVAPNL